MSRFPDLLLAALLIATPALPQGIGREALPEEVAAWNIDIRPDGQGLPEGRGTVTEGEEIFTQKCARCHGDFGESVGRWPALAGGADTLASEDPVKTIGSFWPYLSTVWDYVHRAMPYDQPQSLNGDQTYALVAYLMYLNDLVEDEDFELNRENFASIRLANEAGFVMDDRAEAEIAAFSKPPCMTACKETVEITARVATPELTPGAPPVVAAAAGPDPAQVAAGAKLFRKCKACHQIGDGAKNRAGPVLTNIVGRDAGSIAGFKYSRAMLARAGDGLIWTADNLEVFLTKPKAFIPKTRMSFGGFRKPEDRAAIIAYLQSETE